MNRTHELAKEIRELVVENHDLKHQNNVLAQTNAYLEKKIKKLEVQNESK